MKMSENIELTLMAHVVGSLTLAASSAAVGTAGSLLAGATAVGLVAYGSFTLGQALYEIGAGREWSLDGDGNLLSSEDRVDRAASCGGALFGGGMCGRGFKNGREIVFPKNPLGLERIAPFGNRTGNVYGELPHYHRRVPHPNPNKAAAGQSAPGQGKSNHRPWEAGW